MQQFINDFGLFIKKCYIIAWNVKYEPCNAKKEN